MSGEEKFATYAVWVVTLKRKWIGLPGRLGRRKPATWATSAGNHGGAESDWEEKEQTFLETRCCFRGTQ